MEFEHVQGMNSPVLTACPECGKPVRRKISLPAKHAKGQGHILSDKNISEKGFSKYVNMGNGRYEKAAGPDEAPDVLDRGVMNQNLGS
jgi:putative FmdB family regulatory protein